MAVVRTVKLERPIAKHELQRVGGQFDCDLFTAKGQPPNGCSTDQRAALTEVIKRLEPGHSRIFVTKQVLTDSGQRDALMKTIGLAQDSGATVNLTWWQGPYFRGSFRDESSPCKKRTKKALTGQDGEWPFVGHERMAGFADVIEEARKPPNKFDCVKYVTIQNEVNAHDIGLDCTVAVSQKLYKRLYTLLHEELKSRRDPLGQKPTLRETVDFVGGDLVQKNRKGVKNSNQGDWLAFMKREMKAPLLDGYSIHVYFGPPKLKAFNFRFIDTRMNELRDQIRDLKLELPIYVTEYGVKHTQSRNPGLLDGVNMEDTVVSGFEHAWFNALAPQCGCVGLAKWAMYRTDGPERPFKGWGMICPPSQRFEPLSPTYFVTMLFNKLIDDIGWKAAGLWRSPDKLALVSKFADTTGDHHSLVALNRGPAVTLQVQNLKPNFRYSSLIWNRHGATKPGTVEAHSSVVSNASKVARVTVERDELIAFSTRPLAPPAVA